MVRECLTGLVVAIAGSGLAGCSLILDFSDNQIPKDAEIDGPSSQDECDYKEPNDSLETAAVVTPTDVGPAGICSNGVDDHDFYKFTVPALTASVTVRITFENRPTGDLDLRLFDKTAAVIGQSRGFGNDETIVCPGASPACPMLAPDDYVFEVLPALAGTANRYDIALTLTPM
ncbi:MAG: hypothetical protein H6Q90_2746 [Deltaproteobacteria bacterium]|nr:hypothetical protein [Deltaproteobacteria bacterium]